jgi:hypothetical protein
MCLRNLPRGNFSHKQIMEAGLSPIKSFLCCHLPRDAHQMLAPLSSEDASPPYLYICFLVLHCLPHVRKTDCRYPAFCKEVIPLGSGHLPFIGLYLKLQVIFFTRRSSKKSFSSKSSLGATRATFPVPNNFFLI